MFIVETMETIANPDTLPVTKGSYALVINLPTDVRLSIDRLNKPEMIAGRYIYLKQRQWLGRFAGQTGSPSENKQSDSVACRLLNDCRRSRCVGRPPRSQ